VVVYDVLGREVTRLLERSLPAGEHEVPWTGSDAGGAWAPSGVYSWSEERGERVAQRVVLLR
jgi:hypothetical protein